MADGRRVGARHAGVRLLAFYHLLPAPDNALARRVFARGVDQTRTGEWTIADDGSLYTLPIGATTILRGSVVDFMSVGALTHSSAGLDLALDLH